jgi:flagellin
LTSLLTNVAALSAISSLTQTQRSLAKVQGQMTTGLRVASPRDSAAYWSIATSMNGRMGKMRAVDDGLDLTSSIIATTTSALGTILQLAQGIAKDLVTAQSAGVDVATVQTDIADKQRQIIDTAKSSTFNGVNWLVSQVVGTSSTSEVDVFDTSYAVDQGIRQFGADGVSHESITTTTTQNLTKTLTGSATSTSRGSTTTGENVTLTGQTVAHVHTLTSVVSNQSSSSNSSSDQTAYGQAGISLSVASDGSLLRATQNFHATELFQSFSGTSVTSSRQIFTDQTINGSTSSTPQQVQSPYISGLQDDVLDKAFQGSSGTTNILQMVVSNSGDAALAAPAVDQAIKGITGALTFLAGLQSLVDGTEHINKVIIDALTSGIGALVDSDMNAASTRLEALQTQQTLGIQALSVANQGDQTVLKLFGG